MQMVSKLLVSDPSLLSNDTNFELHTTEGTSHDIIIYKVDCKMSQISQNLQARYDKSICTTRVSSYPLTHCRRRFRKLLGEKLFLLFFGISRNPFCLYSLFIFLVVFALLLLLLRETIRKDAKLLQQRAAKNLHSAALKSAKKCKKFVKSHFKQNKSEKSANLN